MSNQIARAVEDAARKAGQGLAHDFAKAYHSILKDTEQKTAKVAEHAAENEAKTAADLAKAAEKPGAHTPHEPHAGSGGGPASHPGEGGAPTGAGREHPDLGAGRPGGGQHTGGNGSCETGGTDPIDMVSGQMLTDATDLELDGLLPLVLRRAYASGYIGGTVFGPGWSSTLSQRVQIDREGIHYAGDDAQILHYPVPTQPGQRVYPADGARWPLLWDRVEDVIRIEDPVRGTTRHFPGSGDLRLLAALTDRNGHRVDYLRDGDGNPVEVRHSGGYRVAVDTVSGTAGPRVEALRLLDGSADGRGTTVKRFGYDERGRLVQVWGSGEAPLVLDHDDADRIIGWTDTNGHSYRYTYDANGRVVHATGTGGFLTCSLSYDPLARTNTLTDAAGHDTVYEYDGHHHPTRVTDPLGRVVVTDYDRYGHLISHTDAVGGTTRYTRDAHGEPLRVERPDGSCFGFERDAEGLPLRVTDPHGAVWAYSWDTNGNPVEITDPSGARTRYAYDDAGRPTAWTDALGKRTEYRCDDAGLATDITDPTGATTRIERDSFGRPVRITGPLGETEEFTWTVEGRPATRRYPDGSCEAWTWDGEGNRLTHTDPCGVTTSAEYGPFDRPATLTDGQGAQHHFSYDSRLNLLQVTGPDGLNWSYAYDAANRLVAATDSDGARTSYELDGNDRLTVTTNALGQSVRYRYDALGNPVAKETPDGVTHLRWDALGRLLGSSGPGVELTRQLDPLGRIVEESVNGRTATFRYDMAGRLASRRTPSGTSSHWTYDDAGLPSTLSLTDELVRFGHDAAGRELTRSFGASLQLRQTWDARDRLVEQVLAGADAEAVHHSRYRYRADGRPVELWDRSTGTRSLDLDPSGRVRAVDGGDWAERYVHDLTGRVVDAHWPARRTSATGPREYDGTRITSAGRVRYEYDAVGRVTSRVRTTLSGKTLRWSFRWDAEDRLAAAEEPDGTRWSYLYDPLGRRVSKQGTSPRGGVARTDFCWDGDDVVEQTSQGPDLPAPYTLTWDHVESRVVSQRESLGSSSGSGSGSGRTFAVLTDPIGTPLALVDPAGDTAWAARLSVWGDGDRSESSTSRTPLRFPGHYHDPETRLHYNRHRYYDPACGRYLTPDPLGLAAAWDQHSYVDNPLADADPLGLAPCVTIRHYTSKDSYQKIMSGGDKDSILLKASNPSCGNPRGVYVTPMSPAELTKKPGGFKSFLGVTREKSEYLIEFKMPADQFAGRLRGGRAHVWFSPGDVRIPKASITYHGPTANWPG